MMLLLTFSLLYCMKQIDSMLAWVSSLTDHRRQQNVVRTSGSHASSLFFPHFNIIREVLLKGCFTTGNLFVKLIMIQLLVTHNREPNDCNYSKVSGYEGEMFCGLICSTI